MCGHVDYYLTPHCIGGRGSLPPLLHKAILMSVASILASIASPSQRQSL